MGSTGTKKFKTKIEPPIREQKKELSGWVQNFADIINASNNSISFSKVVTILPDKYQPETGKKGDLGTLINKYNIKDAVINMYEDGAGANDLKRIQDLGFNVEAWHKVGHNGPSKIPDKVYFYVKKSDKPKIPIEWKKKKGKIEWYQNGKPMNNVLGQWEQYK